MAEYEATLCINPYTVADLAAFLNEMKKSEDDGSSAKELIDALDEYHNFSGYYNWRSDNSLSRICGFPRSEHINLQNLSITGKLVLPDFNDKFIDMQNASDRSAAKVHITDPLMYEKTEARLKIPALIICNNKEMYRIEGVSLKRHFEVISVEQEEAHKQSRAFESSA